MMRGIRDAVRAATAGGVLATAVLIMPTAAHATLGGCWADVVGDRTGTAICDFVNGGSHFRAQVLCVKYTNSQTRTIHGPWRYTPTQSAATCLIGEYLGDVTVDMVNG